MIAIVSISAPARHKHSEVGLWRVSALRNCELGNLRMHRKFNADQSPDMVALLRNVGTHRDLDAYETIFRHFAPRVRSYMARMGGDGPVAEELMQETMIAVWNKADRFDPSKGAVSTWIFTIARNLRIDTFRREKRPDFDPHDPAFVPDDAVPPDAELDARQASEQLHEAITALPGEQAALLKLAFFEDQSHSEIARRLNLPLGTVKSRMRLAFDKLRAALAHSGDVS